MKLWCRNAIDTFEGTNICSRTLFYKSLTVSPHFTKIISERSGRLSGNGILINDLNFYIYGFYV